MFLCYGALMNTSRTRSSSHFTTLKPDYTFALNLHRVYAIAYASGLRRCEHLYSCAGVSAPLCNYTAKTLVGGGVSMPLC